MNQRALYLRVGAMVLGSIVLLVGLILALTGNRWHEGQAYETYFRESVQGLDVGAPVKFRGVTLGRVNHIGLVSAEYGATAEDQVMDPTYRLIVVRFKIDPRRVGKLPTTDEAVKSGLRAKLANQGLTGVMYLELDFLPPDQNPPQTVPWVPDDDYIPSVPSTFAQIQDSVTILLQHLNAIDFTAIVNKVDGLLDDVRRDLGGSGDVHATLGAARTLLQDLQQRVDEADIPALTAQLRGAGASVQTLADGKQTRELLAQARADLAKLPPLVDSLQRTADHAGNGVNDLRAELIPILQEVRAAVQNLRETTESIRRDPGSVLWQGPPPRDKKP
jgi:ABC-type transporter Mla subunit MlaD